MAAPQPIHAILDPLTEKLGAVFGVRYVLKHRPRRLEYVTRVLELYEREAAGYGSFASVEDVAKVRAFRDELLAEEKAREDAERAELARRDAERRARRAEERRRLEEAAAAAARYEQAQGSWGGGPGETPGDHALREAAATRAATESLFRHTYGQQDWHWRQ
jgi:hypothetical protein